ncbi:MAG: secondary thiamine-phosphate synthase enzyme YjbQ [Candidatus Altiarchaeota archaeon]|nr:secondary thiamine-phosphate synthase enzyme YjbQ [Candidatus Altiarchaeota archaeon]
MMKPKEIGLSTRKRLEFIDITSQVNEFVENSGIEDGAILIFTKHTTSGLTINENEPGLISDMEDLLKKIVPKDGYEHDRIDNNADSHLRSLLLEHSLVLPVSGKKVGLGTWQRVFFVELDGPRGRNILLKII